MSGPSQNEKTALEHLKANVQGYLGYEDSSARERSDQALRTQLIEGISQLTARLSNTFTAENEDDQPRLDSLHANAKKSLVTIGESLENPTYAGSTFFTRASHGASELQRIYELERVMVRSLADLSEEIAAMKKEKMAKEDFEEHFLHIHDYIDNINQSLFEREALILGDMY